MPTTGTSSPDVPSLRRSMRLLLQRAAGLLLVELDQFLESGGVFGTLVGVAEADHPREPQGVPGGVIRRLGDLVGQDFEDDLRFDPDARRDGRSHPGWLLLGSKWRRPFADLAPLLVAEAGADLGDRHKLVGVLVI